MGTNLADSVLADARHPDRVDTVAILIDNERITYGQLADAVDRFGGALRRLGLQPGDRMVIVGQDSLELVAAFLGAMRVGVVGILAPTRISADDLALVVDESGAKILGCDAALRPTCEAALTHVGTACRLLSTDDPSGLADRARVDAFTAPDLAEDAEAFWVCSSGSTGRPKGISHRHQALPDACLAFHRDVLGLQPGDVVLCVSKLPFAYAIGNGLLAPLALGLTIVLDRRWPSVARSFELVTRHRPRVVFSTPTHWQSLFEQRGDPRWRKLAAVELLVSAGERLPVPLAEAWTGTTGQVIRDAWGTSETVFLGLAADPSCSPGSVGKPLPGVEVRLEPRDGDDVGELLIRHPFQATGYGPRREEAARRFSDDGWFRTADLFRIDDAGCWHHMGREDERIKVAGQWVGLPEIEAVLGAHPAVSAGVAVAARDPQGRERVAFCLLPAHGVEPQEAVARIIEAAEQLPKVKRPRWVRAFEAFPRTTTGKIQRRGLRALIEAETRPPQ